MKIQDKDGNGYAMSWDAAQAALAAGAELHPDDGAGVRGPDVVGTQSPFPGTEATGAVYHTELVPNLTTVAQASTDKEYKLPEGDNRNESHRLAAEAEDEKAKARATSSATIGSMTAAQATEAFAQAEKAKVEAARKAEAAHLSGAEAEAERLRANKR